MVTRDTWGASNEDLKSFRHRASFNLKSDLNALLQIEQVASTKEGRHTWLYGSAVCHLQRQSTSTNFVSLVHMHGVMHSLRCFSPAKLAQHLLGCLSWAGRRLLMGWRRQKGHLGWSTRAVLLLHRVVCVVKKDVAPLDPGFGARLVRVTYRIHNLNASVRVKNSVTSPALEGTHTPRTNRYYRYTDSCTYSCLMTSHCWSYR